MSTNDVISDVGDASTINDGPPEPHVSVPIKRACDQCNYRKIKCKSSSSGDAACSPCDRARLRCTSLKIHKPKGPKRTRIESLQAAPSNPVPIPSTSTTVDRLDPRTNEVHLYRDGLSASSTLPDSIMPHHQHGGQERPSPDPHARSDSALPNFNSTAASIASTPDSDTFTTDAGAVWQGRRESSRYPVARPNLECRGDGQASPLPSGRVDRPRIASDVTVYPSDSPHTGQNGQDVHHLGSTIFNAGLETDPAYDQTSVSEPTQRNLHSDQRSHRSNWTSMDLTRSASTFGMDPGRDGRSVTEGNCASDYDAKDDTDQAQGRVHDFETLMASWPTQSAVMGADTQGLSIFNWTYNGDFDFMPPVQNIGTSHPMDMSGLSGPQAYSSSLPYPTNDRNNDRNDTTTGDSGPAMDQNNQHALASGSQAGGTIDPELESALQTYFAHFHPMFPVLKEERVREDLRNGRKWRDPSFATVIETIMILKESKSAAESMPQSASSPAASSEIPRTMGSRLAAMAFRSTCFTPPDVDAAMASFHLFVAFLIYGEKMLAWYRLQEAITMAHMMAPPNPDVGFGKEEHMRLLWILFITERGMLILQNVCVHVEKALRMPDDAYASSTAARMSLSSHCFDDFPVSHLRLFSLIKSDHLACWRSVCGSACRVWTASEGILLQRSLDEEYSTAVAQYWFQTTNRGTDTSIQAVNLVVTIAWFRDRVWNICLRHGLIAAGIRELEYHLATDNLAQITEFCSIMRPASLNATSDCAAKLFDMAMTVTVMHRCTGGLEMVTGLPSGRHPDPTSDSRHGMISAVYRALGLLVAIEGDCPRFWPDLSKAINAPLTEVR